MAVTLATYFVAPSAKHRKYRSSRCRAKSSWSLTQTGDFNGDGKADLTWRNNDGSITIWLMNGAKITSATGLLGPGTWNVVPAAP